MGSFGEKFRTERDRRGFTLDDVSNVTKISPRMLKAIEDERFDQLPGGIFNKGFVRAYAKHLGFNSEEAVSEYLEALRQAQIAVQTATIDEAVAPPTVPPARVAPQAFSLPPPISEAADRNSMLSSLKLTNPKAAVRRKPLPSPSLSRNSDDYVDHDYLGQEQPLPLSDRYAGSHGSLPQALVPPLHPETQSYEPANELRLRQESEHVQWTEVSPEPVAVRGVTPAFSEKYPSAPIPAGRESGAAWKSVALLITVVIVAGILWSRRSHTDVKQTDPQAASTASSGTPSIAPKNDVAKVPAVRESSPPAPSAPAVSKSEVGTTAAVARKGSSHEGEDNGATSSTPASPDAQTQPIRAAAPSPSLKPAPTFRVSIRATENSWISVSADGQLVSRETLIAPAETTVRGNKEIVVSVGNVAGVSLMFNGQPVPVEGAESQVKTFVFDNNGLRGSPAGGNNDVAH